MDCPNLRDMVITPDKGKEVTSTKVIDGMASKDSLSVDAGGNVTKEYTTKDGAGSGPWGGNNARK